MYVLATFTVGKEMLAPAACVTKVAALAKHVAKSNATRILAKLPSLCDPPRAQERATDPWRGYGALQTDRDQCLLYTSRICFLCMFDFFILYTYCSNPTAPFVLRVFRRSRLPRRNVKPESSIRQLRQYRISHIEICTPNGVTESYLIVVHV